MDNVGVGGKHCREVVHAIIGGSTVYSSQP